MKCDEDASKKLLDINKAYGMSFETYKSAPSHWISNTYLRIFAIHINN